MEYSGLSKSHNGVFRPRSSRCSTESRGMSLRHQQSIDDPHDPPSENLLGKRSNSLQSLNSVDHQKTNSKERKTNFKPVKLAWISKSPSEEKNFKTAFEHWKTDTFEPVEPFIYKNKLEESKKKSIDIFLSRNFIEPSEILPTPKLKNVASLCEQHLIYIPDETIPKTGENEQILESDTKSEKKVTFAADSKKISAETRRMNFRNSYSKRYTTNFSFSSPPLEKQTSVRKLPQKSELRTMKRGNSLTLAENSEELRGIACSSPSFKQTIQTEKMKQFAIKRKLKSCRSRLFHKSLDNSSVIENFDTHSFLKPLRSHTEVVTMVSLVVSNEDEEPEVKPQLDKPPRESSKENDKEKPTKSGILKSKWQSENVKRIVQPMQKKRIVNVFPLKSNSFENTTIVLANADKVTEPEQADENVLNEGELSKQNNKSFQSAKEQECWSSFHKMTTKGFSVSFDTILRGLLTPTEYRLRRNELLTQD